MRSKSAALCPKPPPPLRRHCFQEYGLFTPPHSYSLQARQASLPTSPGQSPPQTSALRRKVTRAVREATACASVGGVLLKPRSSFFTSAACLASARWCGPMHGQGAAKVRVGRNVRSYRTQAERTVSGVRRAGGFWGLICGGPRVPTHDPGTVS